MSTIKERKAANEKGQVYSIKHSFQRFFPHRGLATQVVQAVDQVTPILTEGSLLANLHVLRCVESGESPVINQVFFYSCYCAVSYATGSQAQQFKATDHPSLATSYSLYAQCLPSNHTRPERPTYIKDVSVL